MEMKHQDYSLYREDWTIKRPVPRHGAHGWFKTKKHENRLATRTNPNENWMASKLKHSYRYRRQRQYEQRFFDFFNAHNGIAFEVDGPSHDLTSAYDAERDEYAFRRSGIVVLRVKNRDENGADEAIVLSRMCGEWRQRREFLGITASRPSLAMLMAPREMSFLSMYLAMVRASLSGR